MKARYDYLLTQTGQEGSFSEVDHLVRRVMGQDKDITGEIVGSSAGDSLVVLGKLITRNVQQCSICRVFTI